MKKIKRIRLLSVSDVVRPLQEIKGDEKSLQEIDLILSCGDLPPEYLTSLAVSFGAPLFYVCGNHDIRFMEKKPQGCMDIHGRLVKTKGIRILGLEGSIWYNGGPYQYKEMQMRSIIRRLRFTLWMKKGVDIVISHAPPKGIHDQPDPCHLGFASFRRLIDKYQPRYFIHGHIHRDFQDFSDRITTVKRTRVVNTYGFCFLDIEGVQEK
ncbi:MAG: metallophosphoesterase [Desulfobacteraceae bacterium]|nr:MAG: metallophosphoesterase [Desulfobacteraceae bacterium]